MRRQLAFMLFAMILAVHPPLGSGKDAVQPAGTLPVLHDVDVVVVGGTSGGVAAAVAAAKSGAKVFLAAPRPYIGEDICATYRLWLEKGEESATEMAKEVFKPAPVAAGPQVGPGMPFTYSSDVPDSPRHKDTKPPSLLADGKWQSASRQSVEYGGNVTLTLDLGKEQPIAKIHVLAYQRPGDFMVERVTVSASTDKKNWKPVAVIENDELQHWETDEAAMALSAPAATKARYLKLEVKKTASATRVLLGEIVLQSEAGVEKAPAAAGGLRPVTPMQVKRTLDQALIQAGVPFLYGSYATELLRDAQGKPAGIVIANRSGRQAVLAKVIVDATDRAIVARMAGAKFSPYPQQTQIFDRITVGGEARTGENISLRPRERKIGIQNRRNETLPVNEYRVQVQMRDGGFPAFAEAEQLARDWTWTTNAVDASEVLLQTPPDSFRGQGQQTGAWPGADKIALNCFQPAGVERVFALGGCADVSREAAAQLVRPVNAMAVGGRIGAAAATMAKNESKPEGTHVAGAPAKRAVKGEVREANAAANMRVGKQTVPSEVHGLPVLGEYDVVVVGGGTGGAPAAIGAGRQGAKTLLLEYLHGLGGVGTTGYISSYYHGNRVGFTKQVDEGVAEISKPDPKLAGRGWDPEHKSEWYRREMRKAGVDIWYGTLGHGAVVEKGRVKGVVVLTPQGRGVVLAKAVVDATGNADIAAAAGATCRYTDDTDIAVQGTGLPPRELGQKYTNTDYTFVDDNDIFDIWRVLVTSKEKFKKAYDLGQLIDTRERRQIVGDFTLSPMDIMLGRTQPDVVVVSKSNFDTHGYIVHPVFMLRPPHREDMMIGVPYRCLLPRGLDGILVTGLGVSAHRDAIPIIRMQADVQNQGYAAGVAAAMSAKKNCPLRKVDIKALQRHLVEKGNLPETVLTDKDSFPLPKDKVVEAVAAVVNDYDKLEVLLAQFDTARPLLREAFAKAAGEKEKLTYAHILGMMGDATGADVLAKTVSSTAWDEGWHFKGGGQFGASMSPLDSLVVALGRTKSPLALKPRIEKVAQLSAESEFSHFRAVAIALETLGDKAAAKPLAELLQKPDIGGRAITSIQTALERTVAGGAENMTRELELRELYTARALYRCGDCDGLGEKTLKQFAQDLHGHYARHAQAVLGQKTGR
ncbi:MAG: FAD-dependent oxidoreductase [Verrucomicrobia bacterium]|nr:FAD-dependent oxidoreductase [Verrucomicrobiota bacterium]